MKHVLLAIVLLAATAALAAADDRVQLTFDASECDAVLSILEKRASGAAVSDEDWQRLFSSEPYVRLKKRESSMRRDFSDEDFRKFVLSDGLAQRAPALRRTLDAWKKADLRAVVHRILPYLPSSAQVKVRVYPVIKPRTNSFVFEPGTNPAIFLYLDPEQGLSEFENTVAHESHHIGFAHISKQYEERIKFLPQNAQKAAKWMGAFGEGLAVLAAAGSAEGHPLQDFSADQRMRWDQDMKLVDDNMRELNQFFLDVTGGGYAKPEVIDHVAFTFFGYRGPWYTVGYRMGQMVEKRFGRAVLIECMSDPRQLLARYNEAAAEQSATGKGRLALWSPELLKAVGVE